MKTETEGGQAGVGKGELQQEEEEGQYEEKKDSEEKDEEEEGLRRRNLKNKIRIMKGQRK